MRITPIRFIIFALCALSIMNFALAEGVDTREEHQDKRIRQGVKSGELTRREYKHRMNEQKRIDEAQAAAHADGSVSAAEHQTIKAMKDKASANIYLDKHDGQKKATPRTHDQVRNVKQDYRIDQGVQSGALTPEEAAKRRQEQKHISHVEKKAKADGVVSDAEKAKIEALQDRANANIYLDKHDAQTGPAVQSVRGPASVAPAAVEPEPAQVQTQSYGSDDGSGAAQ